MGFNAGFNMTKEEFINKYVGYIDRKSPITVHCKTKELAKEFLNVAEYFGYRWNNGALYSSRNEWDDFKENTAYQLYYGTYSDVYDTGVIGNNLVEFKGFNIKKFKKIISATVSYDNKKNITFRTVNTKDISEYVICNKIEYHEPTNSSNLHYCDIYKENIIIRVFNPLKIVWANVNKEKI